MEELEASSSILESIFEETEDLETLDGDDDIDMIEADAGDIAGAGDSASASAADGGDQKKKKKKKKKNKRRKAGDGNAPNITDINRFVTETCRRLRERKSYLVWNAVGLLGVSAVRDLVKEVDVIIDCGGQKTTDGRRSRTGGGILWNILKTREPKAYKEIMAKGKEFEKQLWQPKKGQMTNMNVAEIPQGIIGGATGGKTLDSSEHFPETRQGFESADNSSEGRVSVKERIRLPVSYEDLFEEGEIHE